MYHILIYDTEVPHVSKYQLDKRAEQKLVTSFELILSKIDTQEQMDSFLLSFMSATERLMLAKRLAAAIMIKQKYTDSEISSSLHLTRPTVSRLKLILEARGQGYEVAFRILTKEKLFKEVKDLLTQLARYSIRSAGGRL